MTTVRYTTIDSPLGELLATDHGDGLSGLYFPEHRRGATVADDWVQRPEVFDGLAEQLGSFFAGEDVDFDLALAPRGTVGQLAVWRALRAIPRGHTTTYGRLAAQLGRPGAARAVAGAVARNPISIVYPCHRVVGADRSLTGYAGGVERKRWLLELEGAEFSRPRVAP